MTRRVVVMFSLLVGLAVMSTSALAHPLGNFTTNQYLGIHLEVDLITFDYVLDLAEVPASQQRRLADSNDDDVIDDVEATAYRDVVCSTVGEGLSLDIEDRSQPLSLRNSSIRFLPGEAGLSTLRLECRFETPQQLTHETVISVRNTNFEDRLGWREMVVTGSGVDVETDASAVSATARLEEYPDQDLSSPADVRSATARVTPDPGAVRGLAPPAFGSVDTAASGPINALASLVDPSESSLAVPLAMAVALGLGFFHALAPGHGKTIMAAYLVGTRGTPRQALILGSAVALSHTVGVLVLGLLTLLGASAFAPEKVFPILRTTSGVIVVLIGLAMLGRWIRSRRDDSGRHPEHHADQRQLSAEVIQHSHGGRMHTHLPADKDTGATGWKLLASMGLAGGLVPSTSAVVLLLAAVNLGRIPLGLVLIVLFGLGMSATLVGVGLLLVASSKLGKNWIGPSGRFERAQTLLTPGAAVVVVTVGTLLTFRVV